MPTRRGDVDYLTFSVQDSGRTRAFLGSVLGLQFTPGRIADGWNVVDSVPMSGLSGGQATEPTRQPYGVTSDCSDDQGTRFYLGQF